MGSQPPGFSGLRQSQIVQLPCEMDRLVILLQPLLLLIVPLLSVVLLTHSYH